MKRAWTQLLLLALLLCGTAQAEGGFPPWTQPVIDLTGTLQPEQIWTLNRKLAAFEARKGSQIGVLVLSSTQPETISQFGIRVFDSWKLGRKGIDDGVLVLLAKDDDYWRIEVGYGLEGALTDVAATRIARDIMLPYFKRGDYYGGLDAGLEAIIKVVDAEPLPPPGRIGAGSNEKGTIFGITPSASLFSLSTLLILVPALVLGVLLDMLFKRHVGRLPSALLAGGLLLIGVRFLVPDFILALVVATVVAGVLLVKRSAA